MNQSISFITKYITAIQELEDLEKILVLIIIAISAHLFAKLVQIISFRLANLKQSDRTKTIGNLMISFLVFAIYFITCGVILHELGVSLGTYIASASVIGIAVGFGTQNLIQDVINGLTIIVADLFTVGDMVEISGQTGIVKQVSMRFVKLLNPLGAYVFIPTRTVTNVINYPKGYVRCLVDISQLNKAELQKFQDECLSKSMTSFTEQFPGILRAAPQIEPIKTSSSGKHYVRVKFRIWPGRGNAIETVFRQDVLDALKVINPKAEITSITVNYEVS